MIKRLTITLLICTILTLSGCGVLINCIQGSGKVIEQTRPTSEFNSVILKGSGNIYFSQGPQMPIKFEAEDNILESIKMTLENKELTIYTEQCIKNTKPINIYITNEDFNELQISGSGKIISESNIDTERLSLTISGSGEVDVNTTTVELNTKISGSGKAKLQGTATTHHIVIAGSGEINANDLNTEQSNIDISGSGKVKTSVSNILGVDISGSGEIEYTGNPTTVNQKISGSGKVQQVAPKS